MRVIQNTFKKKKCEKLQNSNAFHLELVNINYAFSLIVKIFQKTVKILYRFININQMPFLNSYQKLKNDLQETVGMSRYFLGTNEHKYVANCVDFCKHRL